MESKKWPIPKKDSSYANQLRMVYAILFDYYSKYQVVFNWAQSTGPTKSKGESLHVRLHTEIGNDLFQQKVIMIIDFTTRKFQGFF